MDTVIGVVTDCLKLIVREKPDLDSKILCSVKALSEVMIETDDTPSDWCHIYTESGIEGFCLKKYITAKIEEE